MIKSEGGGGAGGNLLGSEHRDLHLLPPDVRRASPSVVSACVPSTANRAARISTGECRIASISASRSRAGHAASLPGAPAKLRRNDTTSDRSASPDRAAT